MIININTNISSIINSLMFNSIAPRPKASGSRRGDFPPTGITQKMHTRNRHLRNHRGLSAVFPNGFSVACSNETSLSVVYTKGLPLVQWMFTGIQWHLYIYIYIYTHTHTSIHISLSLSIYIYIYIYIDV